MTLNEDFSFRDSKGKVWTARAGSKIDGASIPQYFFSYIGGPFSGLYRNASVIHDYHCQFRIGYWKDVHRIFYEGMIASGVKRLKAKVMYAAVYYFGPRWKTIRSPSAECIKKGQLCFGHVEYLDKTHKFDAKEFAKLQEFIEANDPEITEIQKFDSTRFSEIRSYDEQAYQSEYVHMPPNPLLDLSDPDSWLSE